MWELNKCLLHSVVFICSYVSQPELGIPINLVQQNLSLSLFYNVDHYTPLSVHCNSHSETRINTALAIQRYLFVLEVA